MGFVFAVSASSAYLECLKIAIDISRDGHLHLVAGLEETGIGDLTIPSSG